MALQESNYLEEIVRGWVVDRARHPYETLRRNVRGLSKVDKANRHVDVVAKIVFAVAISPSSIDAIP